MKVAYFVHELADAAVRRRIRMIEAGGGTVALLGFHRKRGDAAPPDGAIVLGRTQNQKLLARIGSVVAAIPRALKAQSSWRDADVILARNLEMLFLAILLTRGRLARIVYECLDIHRLMSGDGVASKVLRAIERLCLARVALVITSSPAFVTHHFEGRQRFSGDILLAENKVLDLDNADRRRPDAPQAPPWIIAWCGVLRCKRSFALLSTLAAASKGRVRVELWGAPARDEIPDFDAVLVRSEHMTFHGRYAAEDLPRIYGAAHFAWAIDFFEAGGNSDWLLPNRLYESLAYGAAPIAMANVETGRWLKSHNVGLTLETAPEAALPTLLEQMTQERFDALAATARGIDPLLVRDTPKTCRAFVSRFAGIAA
jgi:succinoglycan biosynthesis protein ExoL